MLAHSICLLLWNAYCQMVEVYILRVFFLCSVWRCDVICFIQSSVILCVSVFSSVVGYRIGDVHSTNIKFNRWCQCWMARILTHLQLTACICVGGVIFLFVFATWCMTIISFAILILLFSCFFLFTFQCHLYCSLYVLFRFCQCRFLSFQFVEWERIQMNEECTRWEKYTGKMMKQSTNIASVRSNTS